MSRRLTEFILLAGFMVMAVALYQSTLSFPANVQNSTAAYIRFLAISLGLLSLLEGALRMRKEERQEKKKLEMTTAPIRFWSLLGAMVLYSVALEPLGFYLASAIFLPLTMFFLGARNPLRIGLTSGGVLLFVFLVFAKLLGVPLPESTLF